MTFTNSYVCETQAKKRLIRAIYFTEDDFDDIDHAHNNPMVILTLIYNFLVKRILVDQGSLANILYCHAAEALGLEKGMYSAYTGTLVRFIGGQVQVDGTVRLQLTVGTQPCVKIVEIDFLIVFTHNNAYNAILIRPH